MAIDCYRFSALQVAASDGGNRGNRLGGKVIRELLNQEGQVLED